MDFSLPINWTSQFQILGVCGVLFHFYSISDSEASDLDLHCLPMSKNWDGRLIWVKLDHDYLRTFVHVGNPLVSSVLKHVTN